MLGLAPKVVRRVHPRGVLSLGGPACTAKPLPTLEHSMTARTSAKMSPASALSVAAWECGDVHPKGQAAATKKVSEADSDSKVGIMIGMDDGTFCCLSGATVELHGGKLIHYAVD